MEDLKEGGRRRSSRKVRGCSSFGREILSRRGDYSSGRFRKGGVQRLLFAMGVGGDGSSGE